MAIKIQSPVASLEIQPDYVTACPLLLFQHTRIAINFLSLFSPIATFTPNFFLLHILNFSF